MMVSWISSAGEVDRAPAEKDEPNYNSDVSTILMYPFTFSPLYVEQLPKLIEEYQGLSFENRSPIEINSSSYYNETTTFCAETPFICTSNAF